MPSKKEFPPVSHQRRITIQGARVHNLKNVNLELPRRKLIVFTGVSGSGKSSLAFDTIYAEGQRRYVESLSSYARQFLERMDKPDVDLIQGISPAVAIEQKTNTRNPRSTVGTTTEVYDYLRLLFARVGKTFCSNCGNQVTRDSVRTVLAALKSEIHQSTTGEAGDRSLKLYVLFPIHLHPKESLAKGVENLKKEGFFRVLVNGEILDLNSSKLPRGTKPEDVEVLIDRLVYREEDGHSRLADSVETAFASGTGRAHIMLVDTARMLYFDQTFGCSICRIPFEEPDPRLFSFNNPFGACPACQGFGRAIGIDMDLVVPDPARTIRGGAIAPWSTPKFRHNLTDLLKVAEQAKLRVDVPFSSLSREEVDVVMNGHDSFDGINGFFQMVERKAYKIYYRVMLSRYRGYTTCPECDGARLRREALSVLVGGKRIADLVSMTIADAHSFFHDLVLSSFDLEIAQRILDEIRKRLAYLNDVGIGYLTLDRLASTLSGGESQRINLATSLGSSLVGALYVLDEPSIGLHPRDNERLINILKALRDVGNTVIVVEHDADMMRASDVIVDLGPRAGENGGEVVFCGTPEQIRTDEASLTGKYLSGTKRIPLPEQRRELNGLAIRVRGAAEHNLKAIDVDIPLNMMVCVTGVSGSGKSTLVHSVLYAGLKRLKGDPVETAGKFRLIEGHEQISAVELVDQTPIGRTPRSNPVTYIHAFDHVRSLFASTHTSKVRGYTPGHFSFNVPGGRCETCEGDGFVKIEMQFLADLFLPCDECKGTRFRNEILNVLYRGRNISDVLNMTVNEAIKFFGENATGEKVARRLGVLHDVGLGYIRLGQAATSLSGGEAQRVKLAAHLSASRKDTHTLFIFDEPTTGLHFDDIATLLKCFSSLIDAGNSVLIIEHNLDVIKCADYVIDLGPEAGDMGGRVVAQGTPEEVALSEQSYTGRFLRPLLNATI